MKSNSLVFKLSMILISIISIIISPNSSAVVSSISKQRTSNIVNDYSDHVTDNLTEFLQAFLKGSGSIPYLMLPQKV